MVIVSPLRIGLFPLQMAVSWLINGGDPNHLLTGLRFQALNKNILNSQVWIRKAGFGLLRTLLEVEEPTLPETNSKFAPENRPSQ